MPDKGLKAYSAFNPNKTNQDLTIIATQHTQEQNQQNHKESKEVDRVKK